METGIRRSHCEKIVIIDGVETKQPKKPFDTLDAAIAVCKIINADPNITEKVVSYKCSVCHKYHVGRNGKLISPKYRKRLGVELENLQIKKKKAEINAISFKVVGHIDLSQFDKSCKRFK